MSSVLSGTGQGKLGCYCWAARESLGTLTPFHFTGRANGGNDITFKIGHADVHFVKNELGWSIYPMVPGNEIVVEVIKVGASVKKFKIGDIAGVGPYSNSCRSCSNCTQSLENYCPKTILTHSAHDREGSVTYGAYSEKIVVDEFFATIVPKNLSLDGAGSLLCAGLRVYSPMKHHGLCQPGQHMGVVGLGGLGHVVVKFAKAFNMKVSVISTSPGKKKEALKWLGADTFLLSNDQQQLQDAMDKMDGIIDTVSGPHSLHPLVGLLKTSGKLILVGAPSPPPELPTMPLLLGRKVIAGSASGTKKESQEMNDFAAKHNITADIEVIPMDCVNTALERLANNEVKYRFVIDVANTLNSPI